MTTPDSSALNSFDLMMSQIASLPLWVKQVIYAQIQNELKTQFSQTTLLAFAPEHTLQLWVPEINRQGMSELEKRGETPPAAVIRLLHLARHRRTVISMAVMNRWSLAQCCEVLLEALALNLFLPPQSATISGTIEYMAGHIRLGEYLVKINRITIDQLDQALRTQKTIQEAMGERVGIANVLINLGYIKKEDSEAILFLKEESRKVFQMSQ